MEELLNVLMQQFELFWVLLPNRRSQLHADLFDSYFLSSIWPPGDQFWVTTKKADTYFESKVTGNLITTSFKNLRWIANRLTDTQTDWHKGKPMKMKRLKSKKTNTSCC